MLALHVLIQQLIAEMCFDYNQNSNQSTEQQIQSQKVKDSIQN